MSRTYPVAEYFISINGEGLHAGYLSAFVRLRNCNLHCSYCDTRWACLPDCPVEEMTGEDILNRVRADQASRVTLTGGEPLLTEGIGDLIDLLGEKGILVEIETNGSISLRPFLDLKNRPVFTMDYKCPGSGMEAFMDPDNFQYLGQKDCVKFVVSSNDDLNRAREITDLYDLDKKCTIFLSPVFGRIEPSRIVEYMKENKWSSARLQLQLHKFIWPPEMRGV